MFNQKADKFEEFLGLVASVPVESSEQPRAVEVLWHFLRDIDPWSLDAWRLFASMGAQRANQQVYDFKIRLRGLLSATPWREVEDMAMEHSRLSSSSSASGTWRLRRAKWWSSWSPRS
ncbi:unnamed protein product [Effrenium voratum]|nr:unnamed protein product [Effrenium voratum]